MVKVKKKIYFFSDAHIGLNSNEVEIEKQKRILKFLDLVKSDASELFILGDLFDFWFEYKNIIPSIYNNIIEALFGITKSGIPVHFIVGNHDYWMKDFFPTQIGVTVYKKPITIERSGFTIHLHHGDGLALDDDGYKLISSILRNKLFIWSYSQLPVNLGYSIGSKLSRKSRSHYTVIDTHRETEGMIKYATAKISNGCDVVMMGHRHQYLYQKIDNGLYINLGDWIEFNTYATFDGSNFKLNHWDK